MLVLIFGIFAIRHLARKDGVAISVILLLLIDFNWVVLARTGVLFVWTDVFIFVFLFENCSFRFRSNEIVLLSNRLLGVGVWIV
jgi:hypothetical protein